jgi:hypothetical protein
MTIWFVYLMEFHVLNSYQTLLELLVYVMEFHVLNSYQTLLELLVIHFNFIWVDKSWKKK